MVSQPDPLRVHALCFDALDPAGLAAFWAGLLGGGTADDGAGGVLLSPAEDLGFALRFRSGGEPKAGPNQIHLDLTSTSLEDQRRTVERALALGGRHLDVGQRPEEGHVVLADPEGNELCVIEPGNRFLAGCGAVGALSCDGSQECGYFWSEALGWPLVWDQDQETAVQAPTGGPKITWGGPPLEPKTGKERLHLDLAPGGEGQRAAVERLLALGARHVDVGQRPEEEHFVLADPDGHELCVLPG